MLLGSVVYVLTSPSGNVYQNVQCEVQGSDACTIQRHEQNNFILAFSRPPELEEEMTLSISYPDSYTLSQAWVQGVNMYMGRSAVVLEPSQGHEGTMSHNGVLFLGACSEKNMQWQLVTTFVDRSTGDEFKLFYNFDTQRR
jgi:protease II